MYLMWSGGPIVNVSDKPDTVFFYVNQQKFSIKLIKDGSWASI